MNDVRNSDRQAKTNASGGGVDYTEAGEVAGLDLGVSEIEKAMASERTRIANSSKVTFEANELQVPQNVDTYDPLSVQGYVPPTITGLQTMEELMAEAEVDSFEEVEEPEVESPAEAELVEFSDDELVFNSDDNTYLNPTTGEIFEAVDDLTGVPEDYFSGEDSEE